MVLPAPFGPTKPVTSRANRDRQIVDRDRPAVSLGQSVRLDHRRPCPEDGTDRAAAIASRGGGVFGRARPVSGLRLTPGVRPRSWRRVRQSAVFAHDNARRGASARSRSRRRVGSAPVLAGRDGRLVLTLVLAVTAAIEASIYTPDDPEFPVRERWRRSHRGRPPERLRGPAPPGDRERFPFLAAAARELLLVGDPRQPRRRRSRSARSESCSTRSGTWSPGAVCSSRCRSSSLLPQRVRALRRRRRRPREHRAVPAPRRAQRSPASRAASASRR